MLSDEPAPEQEETKKEDSKTTNTNNNDKKKEKSSTSSLTIILLSLNLLVVLGVGGYLAYHFIFKKETVTDSHAVEIEKVEEPEHLVFSQIPEIIVNLKSNKPRGNILKVTFAVQLIKKEDEEAIKTAQPIIIDQIMSYLREQTVNDLEGFGLDRLKQAIFERINTAIKPLKIYRLMIKEFIVQ